MIILRKIFLGHASVEFMVSVKFKLNFNRVKFKQVTIFAKKAFHGRWSTGSKIGFWLLVKVLK